MYKKGNTSSGICSPSRFALLTGMYHWRRQHGIVQAFGDGTINFPPYTWVENDKLLEIPTKDIDLNNIGFKTKEDAWEFRRGPSVDDWNPYKVLSSLTTKTVEWIGNQKKGNPFFLYFALPSPHAPIIPNDEFIGKSNAGGYGNAYKYYGCRITTRCSSGQL